MQSIKETNRRKFEYLDKEWYDKHFPPIPPMVIDLGNIKNGINKTNKNTINVCKLLGDDWYYSYKNVIIRDMKRIIGRTWYNDVQETEFDCHEALILRKGDYHKAVDKDCFNDFNFLRYTYKKNVDAVNNYRSYLQWDY